MKDEMDEDEEGDNDQANVRFKNSVIQINQSNPNSPTSKSSRCIVWMTYHYTLILCRTHLNYCLFLSPTSPSWRTGATHHQSHVTCVSNSIFQPRYLPLIYFAQIILEHSLHVFSPTPSSFKESKFKPIICSYSRTPQYRHSCPTSKNGCIQKTGYWTSNITDIMKYVFGT